MKIAYFGLPLGAWLLHRAGYDLTVVVLSPVAAPGRRRVTRQLGHGNVLDFLNGAGDRDVGRLLDQFPVDLLLSWFWTRRLPERWLGHSPLGSYGVHPSLLPRHRGPDPYFAAIDAGDPVTGVTLHRLEAEYDTGEIIASESLAVGELNAWQLARALDRPSLKLLLTAAQAAQHGMPLRGTAQREEEASWAAEPVGDQLRVEWRWQTARVLRRIRALSPVPGLALEVSGLNFFVIHAVPALPPALALEPGEAALVDERLRIRTGDGAIAVERVALAPSERGLDGAALASLLAERGSSQGTWQITGRLANPRKT
jgi:methionyl-tRNA formyltransferase